MSIYTHRTGTGAPILNRATDTHTSLLNRLGPSHHYGLKLWMLAFSKQSSNRHIYYKYSLSAQSKLEKLAKNSQPFGGVPSPQEVWDQPDCMDYFFSRSRSTGLSPSAWAAMISFASAGTRCE
jgi:hypothetical protein